MILEELERAVPIKEGGQMVEMETMRAILRSVNVGAIKGNRFQQKLALEYASAAQASRKADMEDLITNVEAYKQRWQEVFARARRNGDPEPRQIPHPDHVDVDPSTCQIVFKGPQTRDEKKAWDHLKFQIRESERKLRELRADAAARPRNSGLREICALAERHVHRLERMVPPGWDWREKLGWEADYTQKILTSLRAGGS
jgi:carboxylesterase type B